jgi:alpha-L-fucosidase
VDLGRTTTVSIVRLEEDIAHGQVIAAHAIEGFTGDAWQTLATGSTIGYTRLVRVEPTALRRLRVIVEHAVAPPRPIAIRAFGPATAAAPATRRVSAR